MVTLALGTAVSPATIFCFGRCGAAGFYNSVHLSLSPKIDDDCSTWFCSRCTDSLPPKNRSLVICGAAERHSVWADLGVNPAPTRYYVGYVSGLELELGVGVGSFALPVVSHTIDFWRRAGVNPPLRCSNNTQVCRVPNCCQHSRGTAVCGKFLVLCDRFFLLELREKRERGFFS